MVVERHSLFQAEIKAIVTNGMQFLASLEFTPREGLPQEKLVAPRQCIEQVHVNKTAGKIELSFLISRSGHDCCGTARRWASDRGDRRPFGWSP